MTFDLVRVTWVDAHNNQGAWMTRDELGEFAADEAYRVTQVGYLVHEDELCFVLAARLSTPSEAYGQSFGMCERIPRKLIDTMTVLESRYAHGGVVHKPIDCDPKTGRYTTPGAPWCS